MLCLANKYFLYYQGSAEEALRPWGFLQSDVKENLYIEGRVGDMLVILFPVLEPFSEWEFSEAVVYGFTFQMKLSFCHGSYLAILFSVSFGVKEVVKSNN